jgi:hypothetical protein
MKARVAVLAFLLVALGWFAWRGVQDARRTLRVQALCDGGPAALEGTDDLLRGPEAAVVATCRCRLHERGGDEDACVADLRIALGVDPAWLPPAGLAALLARHRDADFEQRMRHQGRAANVDGVRATLQEWIAGGGSAPSARAIYALILDEQGLEDPDATVGRLYVEAVDAGDAIAAPWIREAVRKRLIIGLVRVGRAEDALALYDATRTEFALAGLTREEILNEAVDAEGGTPEFATGELRFVLSETIDARLQVSDDRRALDADWESASLRSDVTVVRPRSPTPVRWVLSSPAGTLASGAVRPRPGHRIDVAVSVGAPAPRAPEWVLSRRPADGRRRLFALVVDCLDWRIVQYLRARGDLPVQDALRAAGHRAVLWTDPPYTAAAMKALVKPGASATTSVLSVLHELGLELEGLESVTANPVGGLRWLLPLRDDLFRRIGSGPYVAANLLFPHGAMDAGEGGVLIGPDGAVGSLGVSRLRRPLTPVEMADHPGFELAADGAEDDNLQRIAAAFDTAATVAANPAVDFVVLRVEAFDLLTHGAYANAAAVGQDDGRGLLFEAYRYADRRIGEVAAALDADDVFVLLSDHGIRTAMEHDNPAVFIAVGPGLAPGRASQSGFEGVSRALATLLGADVPSGWPDTGILQPLP